MKLIIYLLILFSLLGCGVKGDPRPPLEPPELGRGKPTYKGATKELIFKQLPELGKEKADDDEDEKKRDKIK